MNLAIRMLLALACRQPFNRGSSRRIIIKLLKRYAISPIRAAYRGIPMLFHLDNPTEQKALFGYYNNREVNYLIDIARKRATYFVDLGANSGFYSQVFLFHAAVGSRLLSIEPNPAMRARILANIQLIEGSVRSRNIQSILESCAASDQEADLFLNLHSGAGAAHVETQESEECIRIHTRKLLDLVNQHGFNRIDLLKVDIEGHEDKALMPFFENADAGLYPHSIIIEHTSDQLWQADLWGRLRELGYQEILRTRGNLILELPPGS